MSANKLIAILLGVIFVILAGVIFLVWSVVSSGSAPQLGVGKFSLFSKSMTEEFKDPIVVQDGNTFGPGDALTFELFRGGNFEIDGTSGYAWQKSERYLDSAIIRSSESLPRTYKIKVVVGEIDYGLEYLKGLQNDPQYREGPRNENGAYLIAITDTPPQTHYTNDWWHQHRKTVIDVDNNVWGHGMPNPIFMVYFDENNKLVAYDGQNNGWQDEWVKAVEYKKSEWYTIEFEKTMAEYIFTISDRAGKRLEQGRVALGKVWHAMDYPDYFVIGEPHENYYQGSMKIESITLTY